MTDSLLKIQIENLQELLSLKELNAQLLDANHNLLVTNLDFCKKHNLSINSNFEMLLIDIRMILEKINSRSTDNLHQKNQPQDGQSLKTITL